MENVTRWEDIERMHESCKVAIEESYTEVRNILLTPGLQGKITTDVNVLGLAITKTVNGLIDKLEEIHNTYNGRVGIIDMSNEDAFVAVDIYTKYLTLGESISNNFSAILDRLEIKEGKDE